MVEPGIFAPNESIAGELLNRRVAEEYERGALEANSDFGVAGGETLAGSQIKRHVRPTPIVDQKF
jgi:hypothetical protein